MPTRVVLTGAGAVTPLGPDLPSTWRELRAGTVALAPAGEALAPGLSDCALAPAQLEPALAREGLAPRELRRLDPVAQLALCAAGEAAAQAGLEEADTARDGVLLGVGYGATATHLQTAARLAEGRAHRLSPFTIPASMPNAAASELAIRRGLGGPAWTTATACASGLDAVGQAWLLLRAGVAPRLWTGGSEHIGDDWGVGGMAAAKALAPELRPFDVARRGTAVGSAAAVFIAETQEAATARGAKVLAEVLGYGASADAHHITAPDPEGTGAARAMRGALEAAGLEPAAIVGVFAHGTGTPLNDAMEVAAMRQVFGEELPPFTSTKGQYGHTMGASGAVSLALALPALADGILPATVGCREVDPALGASPVLPGTESTLAGPVMINAFGFGGHDASLIVGPAGG
jgi:3-oxoacyl-[acyl-carrier-protein] synthase II